MQILLWENLFYQISYSDERNWKRQNTSWESPIFSPKTDFCLNISASQGTNSQTYYHWVRWFMCSLKFFFIALIPVLINYLGVNEIDIFPSQLWASSVQKSCSSSYPQHSVLGLWYTICSLSTCWINQSSSLIFSLEGICHYS